MPRGRGSPRGNPHPSPCKWRGDSLSLKTGRILRSGMTKSDSRKLRAVRIARRFRDGGHPSLCDVARSFRGSDFSPCASQIGSASGASPPPVQFFCRKDSEHRTFVRCRQTDIRCGTFRRCATTGAVIERERETHKCISPNHFVFGPPFLHP